VKTYTSRPGRRPSSEEVAVRVFLLLLFLLCTSAVADAQTAAARETGRRATVNLKKGAAVSGKFLRADSATVTLEVDGEQATFGLDEVASIVFMEAEPESPAAKAIRALKSLAESAVRARNHREYGNRMLEVKAVVDDQIPLIPEGDLREAVSDALKAYELVSEIWDQAAQSAPQEESAKMTKDAVTTTLGGARKRLEQAEALLKRP
jgi:hypothetical protein